MKLDNDQIELIKGVKRLRKTRNLRRVLVLVTAVPFLFVLWLQLDPQISEPNILAGLSILLILWFKAFLNPALTRARVEDLLFEYINNDPESLQQLSIIGDNTVSASEPS